MEKQSIVKDFTKKIIAIVLAFLMAASCLTGALNAYATSMDDYHDDNLASNFLAWAQTTDEQTAEALLDWADDNLDDLMMGLLGKDHIYLDITIATIDIYLDSIDGIYDTLNQANTLLGKYGGILGGDIKNVDLSAVTNLRTSKTEGVVSKCGTAYRSQNSAKDMVLCLAEILYKNSNDSAGKNVFGSFVRGELNLGSILNGVLGKSVYALLQDGLGMWDGYEKNLVYNLVANIIWTNTDWYTESEIAGFKADLSTWNYDEQLFGKLTEKLLTKINVLVTYPGSCNDSEEDGTKSYVDSSATRLKEIKAKMSSDGMTYKQAAAALGYDPNLVYSDENEGNVLLFVYGDESITLTKTDKLMSFAFRALKFAWNTVLKATAGTIHVNSDIDRGYGSNFDNSFIYYCEKQGLYNESNPSACYTKANVEAWADAVYADYPKAKTIASSGEEFLTYVKKTLLYDRAVVENPTYTYKDIDATTLFGKLRYSPLADLYFNIQTGPLNLYFVETGMSELNTFFDTAFTTYSGMVAGLNDALCAAMKVLMPNSSNIGLQGSKSGEVGTSLSRPTLATTGNTSDIATIASTLLSNALLLLEYTANCTDANLLSNLYHSIDPTKTAADYPTYGNLTEANAETTFVPFIIAILKTIDMSKMIHDKTWDKCKDIEGIAIVALEEYLTYALPDKDYSVLYTYDSNGQISGAAYDLNGDGKNTVLEDVLLIMGRDALGHILMQFVPTYKKDGSVWSVYDSNLTTDTTSVFDILNGVVCYYLSDTTFNDNTSSKYTTASKGKGVATLLGICETSGACKVKLSNTIWQNLDAMINGLLPILGELQYGTSSYNGKFSSYDLLWNEIIAGALDIAPDAGETNGGVYNFLYRLLQICRSAPIENYKIDKELVYDGVLVPLLNTFLGSHYQRSASRWANLIPASSYYANDSEKSGSATDPESPFDSLVQVTTLGYYESDGLLGALIANIYEAFNGTNKSSTGGAACWQAAMFAVNAVNNFIPNFCRSLTDHTLGSVSATLNTAAYSGLAQGTVISGNKLVVKNDSHGLNKFYKDSSGAIQEDNRYYVDVTDLSIYDADGNPTSVVTCSNATGKIAPESKFSIPVTVTAPRVATLVQFVITYDVYVGKSTWSSGKETLPSKTDSNTLYTNQTAKTYLYITPEKSWQGTLYGDIASDATSATYSYSGNTTYTKSGVADGGRFNASYPKDFIVQASDADTANKLFVKINGLTSGGTYAYTYAYPTASTRFYPVTDGEVASTMSTAADLEWDDYSIAYAAINKDGDILNTSLVDYTTNGGTSWTKGVTPETAASVYDGLTDEQKSNFESKTHVTYTIDEALAADVVYGVIRSKNAAGSYEYSAVLVDPETTNITFGTPTMGLNLAQPGSTSVAANGSTDVQLFNYDGKTSLSSDSYTLNLALMDSTKSVRSTTSMNLYVSDSSSTQALQNKFNSVSSAMAAYQETEIGDYTEEEGLSPSYQAAQAALKQAAKTLASPLTADNARGAVSTMITRAKTSTTTSKTGSVAYVPLSTSATIPEAMADSSYAYNGIWYGNEEHTMPIYTNTLLTSAGVTAGKDAAGIPVTLGSDGKYYYTNTVAYEEDWDADTYATPYWGETSTPATNDQGDALYKQVNFVYRNSTGAKVSGSTAEWTYMVAEGETVIKPNDGTEYRGLYQRQVDNLSYVEDQVKENVSASAATNVKEQVLDDWDALVDVDYERTSLELLRDVKNEAENLLTLEGYQAKDGTVIDKYQDKDKYELDAKGNWISVYSTTASAAQISNAIRVYNFYKSHVIARGYYGDRLKEEVVCATGNAYTTMSTSTTEVEGKTVYTVSTTASTVEYGAVEGGKLVNKGEEVYSETSWNNYVNALGKAIDVINAGEASASSDEAKISDCYEAKKALKIAENELSTGEAGGDEGDTIAISGTVCVALNSTATNVGNGISGVSVVVDGKIVGTTDENGAFTVNVEKGTTTLSFEGSTTVTRTATISGTSDVSGAKIALVVTDYNGDGLMTTVDKSNFKQFLSKKEYSNFYDLNRDGLVTSVDYTSVKLLVGKKVTYSDLVLE